MLSERNILSTAASLIALSYDLKTIFETERVL